MISLKLQCSNGHLFDGWFASSASFESQVERGLLTCPHCGDTTITRALMAPAIRPSRSAARHPSDEREIAPAGEVTILPPEPASGPVDPDVAKMRAMVKALRDAVRENGTDVGKAFPEEARKIHYGEAEERGIYGQATLDDAKALWDEGIEVVPLPSLPEDKN